MWVRGMTSARHSDCQGGLSPVQTQRGNDGCAQFPVIRWRLGERAKSTYLQTLPFVQKSAPRRRSSRRSELDPIRGTTGRWI